MLTKKHVLIGFAIVGLVAALVLTLMEKPVAPTLAFTTLDGRQVPLNSLRGKVVLVNFWATSCPGCVKEMPRLAEVYRKFQPRGLEIVAVAMSYDSPEYVRNYVRERSLPFTVALDSDGEAARAFDRVNLTPTTFLIDKEGRIIRQTIGELDFSGLNVLLEQQLGGAKS